MDELTTAWAKHNGYHVKEYEDGPPGSYTNKCVFCGEQFIGYKNDMICGRKRCNGEPTLMDRIGMDPWHVVVWVFIIAIWIILLATHIENQRPTTEPLEPFKPTQSVQVEFPELEGWR